MNLHCSSSVSNCFTILTLAGISNAPLFLHSFSPCDSTVVLKLECAEELPGGLVTAGFRLRSGLEVENVHFYLSQVLLDPNATLGTTVMLYSLLSVFPTRIWAPGSSIFHFVQCHILNYSVWHQTSPQHIFTKTQERKWGKIIFQVLLPALNFGECSSAPVPEQSLLPQG